jgi:hypothetical protein
MSGASRRIVKVYAEVQKAVESAQCRPGRSLDGQ